MDLLLVAAIAAASALLGYQVASRRNKNRFFWAAVCLFFPFFGHVVLAQLRGDKTIPASASAEPTDEVKWQLLIQLDKEVQAAAAEVCKLGPAYEEMLAANYLGLADKKYLGDALASVLKKHREDVAAGVIPS